VASLQELLQQKAAIDRQIADAQSATRAQAIANIRALMSENGLTAADISAASTAPRKPAKTNGTKVAPKYREPKSGQTWSGRGLKPRWLSEALAGGKTLADFAI
jgi:DNA-binding protein H-NS